MLELEQIAVLEDNYIYLIYQKGKPEAAVIDPAEAAPVMERLQEKNLTLTHILNTHHHADHVGGNITLAKLTGCEIIGAGNDQHRIPGISRTVFEGDSIEICGKVAKILSVPGHTLGHIAYWFVDDQMLFCGDTLFSLGCGRLFEGDGPTMWQSLQKFRSLPDDTQVICAHEYTAANADFALSIDGDNLALIEKVEKVRKLRRMNQPTVPCRLGEEKHTNPFLRADDPKLAQALGMANANPAELFSEMRARKDRF